MSLIIEHGRIPVCFSEKHASNGGIVVELGVFSGEKKNLYSLSEKLSYIFTDQLGHLFGIKSENQLCQEAVERELCENEILSQVISVLKAFMGVEVKVVCNESYPGVYCQSSGASNELFWLSDEELLFYLISPNCGVELGDDNN